jgi:hypothetical protein
VIHGSTTSVICARRRPGARYGLSRMWALKGGIAYAADSPRLFFELIEAFDDIGMKEIVGEYLDEPPMLLFTRENGATSSSCRRRWANGTRTRSSTAPPHTRARRLAPNVVASRQGSSLRN